MSVLDGDNKDDLFLIQFFLPEEYVCTQSLMFADFREPLLDPSLLVVPTVCF